MSFIKRSPYFPNTHIHTQALASVHSRHSPLHQIHQKGKSDIFLFPVFTMSGINWLSFQQHYQIMMRDREIGSMNTAAVYDVSNNINTLATKLEKHVTHLFQQNRCWTSELSLPFWLFARNARFQKRKSSSDLISKAVNLAKFSIR